MKFFALAVLWLFSEQVETSKLFTVWLLHTLKVILNLNIEVDSSVTLMCVFVSVCVLFCCRIMSMKLLKCIKNCTSGTMLLLLLKPR